MWSHFFDKLAGWKRSATLLTKTPAQVLCPELCEILKNTFFRKIPFSHELTAFLVFPSRSVPIPKIRKNRCGMECLNVKGVHRKCYYVLFTLAIFARIIKIFILVNFKNH